MLESAIAQPKAAFGGTYLHDDPFLMAAAYLYHPVKNHPFVDGNKRVGLVAAVTFLAVNGEGVLRSTPRLYDATIAVAEGRLDKEGLASLFREVAAGAV